MIETFEEFENWLMTEECFDNHDVSYIDNDGNQHYLKHSEYISYLGEVTVLIANKATIKVEQIEKWFPHIAGTAHAFYNNDNGPSFDTHTDPIDVLIECIAGRKTLEVEGKEYTLEPRDKIGIAKNTEHRALNYEKALMISYGIGDTETLTRIRKND